MTQACDLVQRGDVEGLERELGGEEVEEGGKKVDLTCRSCDGRTLLELAAVLGRAEVVKLLLRAGAPPNQASSSGGSLTLAVIAWGAHLVLPHTLKRYNPSLYSEHMCHASTTSSVLQDTLLCIWHVHGTSLSVSESWLWVEQTIACSVPTKRLPNR